MASEQTFSIKSLKEEDIQKAFEKTRSKWQIPGVRLVRVTEEHYEQAIKLFRDDFIPYEPICKAIELEWSDVIEAYMMGVLREHLSLMFIDEKTNDAIAFRTTATISRYDDKFKPTPPIPLAIQDLLQYLDYCDGQAKFFDHFRINEAFRFVSLVVTENYKRRGLATQIFQVAKDFIRNFGFERVFIKGEGTSNYSKKIYEREGFETLYENVYSTWEVDGRHPLTNTGEHKSIKIYGREITQNE